MKSDFDRWHIEQCLVVVALLLGCFSAFKSCDNDTNHDKFQADQRRLWDDQREKWRSEEQRQKDAEKRRKEDLIPKLTYIENSHQIKNGYSELTFRNDSALAAAIVTQIT